MLIDTVRQTIRAHDLIHKGDHIVLGLSGGPDSVCLFHVLLRIAEEFDLTIHPVHINHQFRPGAAERDQAYVEELCAKAGASAPAGAGAPRVLPCSSFVVDCNALAKELGMTSEEAGRKARYDAFVQVAEETAGQGTAGTEKAAGRETAGTEQAGSSGAIRIAVAQNANDQAETILHRILRGTGTDGLSGIAYQRMERGIPVVRPLLDVPREEIEAYCEENGLEPVIDHTNLEPVYTRNRIRLELLPVLAEYNENIIGTLARLGRIAAADKECLWQQVDAAYAQLRIEDADGAVTEGVGSIETEGTGNAVMKGAGNAAGGADPGLVVLDRAGLASQPEAIRHRVITRAFAEIGLESDISEERLRAADAIIMKKQAPKTVQFPRGYSLTVKQGKVFFRAPSR